MNGTVTQLTEAGEHARADIYRDGITACPGAFSRDWADTMRDDIEVAFRDGLSRPGGAVGRGPHRYYVERRCCIERLSRSLTAKLLVRSNSAAQLGLEDQGKSDPIVSREPLLMPVVSPVTESLRRQDRGMA
jgi:hypothetical protein